jgi:two-component system, OmpR family, phosphate regulon sensor histidine kinase PhoR
VTVRTRAFLSVFLTSVLALTVSTWLVERSLRDQMLQDIRAGLLDEARLAAYLVVDQGPDVDEDAQADAIATRVHARVTLIGGDGVVLGDSEVDRAGLATLENHATREEVVQATSGGEGSFVRLSRTTGVETQYVAVRTARGRVHIVRLALPLTSIADRVNGLRRLALVGLGAGLLAALFLTTGASVWLSRRLHVVADTARRYEAGDFSTPARDHGRDEIGQIANVLDGTARELGSRLAEMGRERAHMDAILTGMVEGVVLVDADGRLVLTNPAVRSMLKLPLQVDDPHYLEVVRQPDIAAEVAAALAGRQPSPIEVLIEGMQRRIYVANVVPVASERGGGAVLVLHDITDLRHADQVRRDFVANVSHELRTPLTAIRGYVEAMFDATNFDEARQFLDIIARHALRMERLVRDLLRLARLDSGQETFERHSCTLGSLIDGVVNDLSSALEARDQRVETSIAADASVVIGDNAKLHDVLRNLLENAANYSPDGGVIEVHSQRDSDVVELTVSDRGPGVPEADLPRIFERFYRVDRSRSRDPGGTGLGLSIVKHLVELHGGTVSATNRAGGGASLRLRLPAGDDAGRS